MLAHLLTSTNRPVWLLSFHFSRRTSTQRLPTRGRARGSRRVVGRYSVVIVVWLAEHRVRQRLAIDDRIPIPRIPADCTACVKEEWQVIRRRWQTNVLLTTPGHPRGCPLTFSNGWWTIYISIFPLNCLSVTNFNFTNKGVLVYF